MGNKSKKRKFMYRLSYKYIKQAVDYLRVAASYRRTMIRKFMYKTVPHTWCGYRAELSLWQARVLDVKGMAI
jgi:hypothetical protein